MFSYVFLQVTQMQLELHVFPFAKHSQYNFKQSIFVHLQPCCSPCLGDKFKFSIVFNIYSVCCILLKFKEEEPLKTKVPSSSSISNKSFFSASKSMTLSRSFKFIIFKDPDEDEECRDGNLKLLCIFNYKLRLYYYRLDIIIIEKKRYDGWVLT